MTNASECTFCDGGQERLRSLRVAKEVLQELARAAENNQPMASAHEGYAVLLEEVDELWEHVRTNPRARDVAAMREEAIQVAAMAIRFILDVTDKP